jgi:hypothetical protein
MSEKMDSFQLYLIPAIISALVTVIIWLGTYVMPYIWPEGYAKFILFIQRKDPNDPIDISLIINQFLKYDDWKRLTAKERLKRMFKRKISEIEDEKRIRWDELKDNTICVPLKTLIDMLKYYLGNESDYIEFNDDHDTDFLISENYLKEVIPQMDENEIKKELKKFSGIYKGHKNANVWFLVDSELPLGIKGKVSDYKSPLTSKELAVLLTLQAPHIDSDGSWDKERYLKAYLKESPPEIYEKEELNEIFQNIILYLDYTHQSSGEKLFSKFALGLSNHEKSSEKMIELIKEVKIQIYKKELSEVKSKLNRDF